MIRQKHITDDTFDDSSAYTITDPD